STSPARQRSAEVPGLPDDRQRREAEGDEERSGREAAQPAGPGPPPSPVETPSPVRLIHYSAAPGSYAARKSWSSICSRVNGHRDGNLSARRPVSTAVRVTARA